MPPKPEARCSLAGITVPALIRCASAAGDSGIAMDGHGEKAFLYRQRAEELRVMADDVKDRRTREVLLRLAHDYERLAVMQDQLAKTNS